MADAAHCHEGGHFGVGGSMVTVACYAWESALLLGHLSQPKSAGFGRWATGSGYQILHEFSPHDGDFPEGDLTLAGSSLYGTTREGGLADGGILYSIELDGSNFQVLHRFQGATDGQSPVGDLAYLSGVLYGTTSAGAPLFHTAGAPQHICSKA